ncbi:hypothetical protein EIP91_007229 [Steccherinum ochraceum]|uniref:FYVE, RhoGEF and PH domain-containing protein 6 n=1 Tax=Steccherinum ochraceum TaxID=92696 RepID=A0A4R0R6X5_9APHY|nr:hypothetical protein EIP91_007229 [Steccherinum ochraceum]
MAARLRQEQPITANNGECAPLVPGSVSNFLNGSPPPHVLSTGLPFPLSGEPSSSSSMVSFPTSQSRPTSGLFMADALSQPQPTQYLPFRRISLPTAPSLLHRQSVVSTASFDSLAEDGPAPPPAAPSALKGAQRIPRTRPSSLEPGRRNNLRRREVRVVDERRDTKRRKIIDEFYETERTYVEGLELVYSHFLTPIIASLDTPSPLLDRNELTAVFSNFIDIWNFHRSFFSSLTNFLHTCSNSHFPDTTVPPISPILLSHFPYLSLYTPFVTSFPDMLSSYTSLLSKNPAFSYFISTQEADPRCAKLKLRDWLLTIVQRCPRYLLLLKDLISCTDFDDSEYAPLTEVQTLVSRITEGLNTSLHTHAQTVSLLALQRSTANLPFRLITPGRSFLKRATLLQLEGSKPRDREFLLFSDCLLWIASADKSDDAELTAIWELSLGGSDAFGPGRPSLQRTRSRSDADFPALDSEPVKPPKRRESILRLKLPTSSSKKKKRHASIGAEERWVYKGHLDLVNLDVVVPPPREPSDSQRLDIMSPQSSFSVYFSNEEERDQWRDCIRDAKSSLLVSLNATNPNSTLTSSTSTQHLRQTLQALPYSPEEEEYKPKRGRVEHFVPAIWIPDGRTESCMRCGRTFGWRRRRHHCRLCGRCICATCSEKTFFILDPDAKNQHRAARACNACYDTVFPLMSPQPADPVSSGTLSHLTLSGLRSMPSLLLPESLASTPSNLMAIGSGSPKRPASRLELSGSPVRAGRRDLSNGEDGPSVPAYKMRPQSARPRSYIQILEDFHHGEHSPVSASPSTAQFNNSAARLNDSDEALDGEPGIPESTSLPPSPRKKEDTARRHKRFSLPAVAIQATPVMARPSLVGEGRMKRFSLVMGKSTPSTSSGAVSDLGSSIRHSAAAGKLSELLGRSTSSSTS